MFKIRNETHDPTWFSNNTCLKYQQISEEEEHFPFSTQFVASLLLVKGGNWLISAKTQWVRIYQHSYSVAVMRAALSQLQSGEALPLKPQAQSYRFVSFTFITEQKCSSAALDGLSHLSPAFDTLFFCITFFFFFFYLDCFLEDCSCI